MNDRHRHWRRHALRYGLALLMVGASIGFRFAMTPLIGPGYQYVTVFPLIIAVAILAGRGPAILHAFLAGSMATYFFSTELNLASILVTLLVFATGFLAGGLAQRMHNALAQARRRSEELAESELFYRQALESIPGMVFTTRPDGYCDYQSSQWVEFTGVPMEQMIGDGWNRLLHPDDQPRALAAWRAAVAERGAYDLEYRVRRRDGQYEWFKVRGRPIRDAAGNIVRWLGVAANINELKKTEDALKKSETRFRGTFENAAVGITHLDLNANWLEVNLKFCEMVGYSREALIGSEFTILTHPDDIEEDRRRFYELRQGLLKDYFIEKRYVRKDGGIIWVALYRAVQRDESGKPLYTIAVIIDITERKQAEEELHRSRTLLAEAEKLSRTGAWEWDLVADKWSFSEEWLRIHGCENEVLTSDELIKLAHPDDQDRIARALEEVKNGVKAYKLEHRIIRSNDGAERIVRAMGRYVRDRQKNIVKVYGFAQDITEQKQAAEALRRSEERLRGTFDYAGVGIVEVEANDRLIAVNNRACQILGRNREQLLSMNVHELTWPEDRRLSDLLNAQLHEGLRDSVDYEKRYIRGDGSPVWVHVTVAPVRDANGRWIRSITTIEDITLRKEAEEALRESERRFRELADSMPQIVWSSRPDGVIDYFNRKWAEVTEGDLSKIGDQGWVPALPPEDVQRISEMWYESIRTGKEYYNELRLKVRGRNEYRWYIARALPIRDERGSIVRWFGTATDIHELKQIQESQAALKSDLENKNRELESIIGIVSHDLRAPLVNIQGFSHELRADCQTLDSLLSRVPLEPEAKKRFDKILHRSIPESIQYIKASSDAMNNLVISLVEVARAGMTPVRPEVINMDELMSKIIDNLKIKFKEADVQYDVLPLPACFADRTHVTQIFTNLLDNAVKYLDPSRPGQICVEGTPQADGILYWVSDNGIGIAPQDIEKIFEPYYQLKEKTSGGFGMGLATVKKLIDRNQGKIWVISEKGQYAIFYVALPAPGADNRSARAGRSDA